MDGQHGGACSASTSYHIAMDKQDACHADKSVTFQIHYKSVNSIKHLFDLSSIALNPSSEIVRDK